MRLTKQTGHAIRILVDCARAEGGRIKVADIAAHLALTPQNVFKIVHLLSRAGFVACTRGPTGGVKLARAPQDIRIGDVVRAMEATSVKIARDVDRTRTSSSHSLASDHAVNEFFSEALTAFISVLDAHTLAELAAAHRSENSSASLKRDKPGAAAKPARGGNPRRVGRKGARVG